MSPDQIQLLQNNSRNPYFGKRGISSEQRQAKADKIKVFQLGVTEVAELNKRELFIAGVALYWAEGFKDNLMGFSNSDPSMIRFMMRWLREACEIDADRLRFRLALNDSFKTKTKIIENTGKNY